MDRDSGKKSLGAAIDIGTSDIKGVLLDISSKKELARSSVPNEQRSFGPDVITRLHFAMVNKKGLSEEGEIKDISTVASVLKDALAEYRRKFPYLVLSLPEEKGFL